MVAVASIVDAAGSASGTSDASAGGSGGIVATVTVVSAAVAGAPVATVPVAGGFSGTPRTNAETAGSAAGSSGGEWGTDYLITPLGAGQLHAHATYMPPGMGGAPTPPSEYARKKRRRKPRVLNANPKPFLTGMDSTTALIPPKPDYLNADRMLERIATRGAPDDDSEALALILQLAA
jgi:hypothetical protein